jgi:SNF2 family DNA or RNA helicase
MIYPGGLSWKGDLFPYQRIGVERLVTSHSVLLADEMGLGKTIQAIAAIRLLRTNTASNSLVVAPAGLVRQWRRQLRDWAPELRLSTVVGTANERTKAWATRADVHIASYETVRSDLAIRAPFGPGVRSWEIVAIDEAQRIKNPTSTLAMAVKALKRNRSWALTGTPLENRLEDLISILDFVAPGRFDRSKMMVGLRDLLADVQLRRRRNEVLTDLPPKLVSRIDIELTPQQRVAYRRAEQQGLIRLRALGPELRITHVLELILRLKQLCNFCPESGASAKLADLKARLGIIKGSGAKSLVFSQFVEEPFGARRVARELASFSPLLLAGEVDYMTRARRLADFERDPVHSTMILSLKVGGVGLNLTAASHVFHFDRWWNPAVETQAEDRAHRIGQTRPVHVHAYVSSDTIEERIEEIIAEKRALFADIVDGVDTSALRRLNIEVLMNALERDFSGGSAAGDRIQGIGF